MKKPEVVIDADPVTRPEHLFVPEGLPTNGTLIEFPAAPKNALRRVLMNHGTLTVSMDGDGETDGVQIRHAAKHNRSTIRPFWGTKKDRIHRLDLRDRWVIYHVRKTVGVVRYDQEIEMTEFTLTNPYIPMRLFIQEGSSIYLDVYIHPNTIPLRVNDYTRFRHANIESPFMNRVIQLTEDHPQLPWVHQNSPVCTFTFLTPQAPLVS